MDLFEMDFVQVDLTENYYNNNQNDLSCPSRIKQNVANKYNQGAMRRKY